MIALSGIIQSDDAKKRLDDTIARADAHNVTVKKGQSSIAAPEMTEYVERWKAFQEKLKKAKESEQSSFSWVTEGEALVLEAELRLLMTQWEGLSAKINVSKNAQTIEVLEEIARKKAAGLPTGSNVVLPDSAATMPISTDDIVNSLGGQKDSLALVKGIGVGVAIAGLIGVGIGISRALTKG